jgi:hypothetical protein
MLLTAQCPALWVLVIPHPDGLLGQAEYCSFRQPAAGQMGGPLHSGCPPYLPLYALCMVCATLAVRWSCPSLLLLDGLGICDPPHVFLTQHGIWFATFVRDVSKPPAEKPKLY